MKSCRNSKMTSHGGMDHCAFIHAALGKFDIYTPDLAAASLEQDANGTVQVLLGRTTANELDADDVSYNHSARNTSGLASSEDVATSSFEMHVDYHTFKWFLLGVLQPAICCFGILGNALNIIILTRKRFHVSLDTGMEKAAICGMTALAVSDMAYCISALPEAFFSSQNVMFTGANFFFLYKMYGKGIQQILSFTSTWLTVLLATARYIAICHPLQARSVLDLRATLIAILGIVVACVVFSLPLFWALKAHKFECPADGLQLYVVDQGPLSLSKNLKMIMNVTWFFVCFVVPVTVLTYCNVHLIRALRESIRMRKQCRANGKTPGSQSNCITPTLIAVIIVFIILVAPAKILSFFFYVTGQNDVEIFNVVLISANVMNTLNFSINFVLYCAVNKKFRSSIRDMLHCKLMQRKASIGSNATCTTNNKCSFTRMSLVTHGRVRIDKTTSYPPPPLPSTSHDRAKAKATETSTFL